MPYEHAGLLSEDCHEPKHITDSTGRDAGKVLTPTRRGGSSELRFLRVEELEGYEQAASGYATLSATGNSKTVPFNDAAPVEINSLFQITGPTLNIESVNNVVVFQASGVYEVLMMPRITTNSTINIFYSLQDSNRVTIDTVSTGDTVHGAFLVEVNEGDSLQLLAGSTQAPDSDASPATVYFNRNIVIKKVV